ncbi:MAG: PKD domain-containing protein [bacterium]
MKKLLLVLFISLTLTIAITAAEVKLDSTVVYLTSPEFSMPLRVNSVNNLYGAAFDLGYDTNLLEIQDVDNDSSNGINPEVVEGTILNQGGIDSTILISGLEDKKEGKLIVGIVRDETTGVNINIEDILLSIGFRAKNTGVTNLIFDSAVLKDSYNSTIDASWISGNVIIYSSPADIETTPSNYDLVLGQALDTSQILLIKNKGGEPLRFTITDSADWLTENITSGTISKEDSTLINLNLTTSLLPPGIHTAQLEINSNDSDNSLVTIPISLLINNPPEANFSNIPNPLKTGYGKVEVSIFVSDFNGDINRLKVEYSPDGLNWNRAELEQVNANYGTPVLNNQNEYQISNIKTDSGVNNITFYWRSMNDLSGIEDATVYLRISTNDGWINGKIIVSSAFEIDNLSPLSTVTNPWNGEVIVDSEVPIDGIASDSGSGIERIEVSTDGGSTWVYAQGTTSWSYEWTPSGDKQYTVMSRATDKAGNEEIPGIGINVTIFCRRPSNVTASGRQLLINSEPFTVKAVDYSPVPVGIDPEESAPYGDYFKAEYKNIYERDLALLRQMGANAIHVWNLDSTSNHLEFLDKAYNGGVNPIYIIAGYRIKPGLNIDLDSTDNVREEIKSGFKTMIKMHENHPAVLMWSIGNDLNAEWKYGAKPDALFSLIDEMAEVAHIEEGESYHPVTTPLFDSNLINVIGAYDNSLPNLDVWGAGVYRGGTFGSLFSDYETVSSKPFMILGYGIDTYDNVNKNEYENIGPAYQAENIKALWNEIKANSSVCIGGSIRTYSDEWWKGKYSTDTTYTDNDPGYHGTTGHSESSSPDGYLNEEWCGIMRVRDNGLNPDIMEPRFVYYMLESLWGNGILDEKVSIPCKPEGEINGIAGETYIYTTKDASSSKGHNILYKFQFGDGTYSDWGDGTAVQKTWFLPDKYLVKAQTKCENHDIISGESIGLLVNISQGMPSVSLTANPVSGNVPLTVNFKTDVEVSDGRSIVSYEWDFDGDYYYDTITLDSTASYTYNASGTYNAKVKVTDDKGAAGECGIVITAEEIKQTIIIYGSGYNYLSQSFRAGLSLNIDSLTLGTGWLKYYYTLNRLSLVSTTITEISVNNNIVTIKGIGTVNGGGGYSWTAIISDSNPDSMGIEILKPDGSLYFKANSQQIINGDYKLSVQ